MIELIHTMLDDVEDYHSGEDGIAGKEEDSMKRVTLSGRAAAEPEEQVREERSDCGNLVPCIERLLLVGSKAEGYLLDLPDVAVAVEELLGLEDDELLGLVEELLFGLAELLDEFREEEAG